MLNEHQVIQRSCGLRRSCGWRSLEGITCLPIMLQIRRPVAHVDAMLLEESMDLSSGVIPEQASQLCSRELIFTVGFKGKGFDYRAREVLL
jgi:hypothetical protein